MTLITSTTTSHRHNGIDPRELVPAGREIGRPDYAPPAPAARRPRILSHPIAQHALTALRDRRTRARHVRFYSNQLLNALTLEATASLALHEISVETTSGTQAGKILGKPVIFMSLTRHGLGLAHNVTEIIPGVSIGSITLEKVEGAELPVPRLHLSNAPSLQEARVIVFDPTVTTGKTAALALQLLRKSGAGDLVLASFIMSNQGLDRIMTTIPDLTVITGAIDGYDQKRGLQPGMGDFAARLYETT